MDYELYDKIKKGNMKALRALQDELLPGAWFVCCLITDESSTAAELLRQAWGTTVQTLAELGGCPRESFRTCLSGEIYRLSKCIPHGDEMFSSIPFPTLASKFDIFIEEIRNTDREERTIYLLNKLGELGNGEISNLLDISLSDAKKYLNSLEDKIHPRENGREFSEYIRISGEFRHTNKRLFENIASPELLISTLEHDYNSIFYASKKHTGAQRKDKKEMAQQPQKPQSKQASGGISRPGVSRKAAQKKKKTIIVSVIAAILVIAIIVTVVLVAQNANRPEATRITTYYIDEITYGNVSTTISGSGSLSPITKATLTIADCIEEKEKTETDDTSTDTDTKTDSDIATQSESGTNGGTISGIPSLDTVQTVTGIIGDVAVSVGDTVAEGDVIAVVTFDDETTANILAPYDAVLLEFYLHDDDEVTMTSNVAMFMGMDGYSMTISVDETNISTVELGQEVTIAIDAVDDGDCTGYVTDISYNGSTSGSVTAYGITVTFDYIEGTYPGMSVSAEIVIEDSGDGLLVPVDAVYTSGDTNYIYLAQSDASLGDEYEEGDIDTSKLTKVTVETGMSNGSFIIIESDELKEGDLIVITEVSSTLTGSESDGNSNGGMGGFGGGGMGGFGGGGGFPGGEMPDFGGDFDFSGGFPGFN